MRTQAIRRLGLASLAGAVATLAAASASADVSGSTACDAASLTCSVGTAALNAKITNQLPTVIDSGNMGSGKIVVRTRFTIDPVKGADPLLAVAMPKGALVKATWNEKGFVNLATVTEQAAQGTMNVHYTLTPSLEANIYGIGVKYDAAQLINKVPGGSFHYDAKATTSMLPWGFAPTVLKGTPPALDQSTIFAIPFSQLGISTGLVEGTLAIQASANPTFTYTTKQVRLDSESVSKADGLAKLAIGDDDFLDLSAAVSGEIQLGGTLDIRPAVKVDTVDGFPTFGLVKYSFTAVSPKIGGNAPVPVNFDNATIHIPLPNLKVPSATLAMGSLEAGQTASKSVTIDSTGELGGKMTFTSSDPQFTVPSGEVTVGAKGKYELKVGFKPTSASPASATITVKSNDPGDPEQTFRVAANGAPTGDESSDGTSDGDGTLDGATESSGCAVASTGGSTGSASTYGLLGLGLGLAAFVRRRRSR
ncbi:MAG TPA: MYXO-CTERM sorting domain-containing protein [Labilithrix sp.]|nr:MYXO-CTERM sorting domain-containing protein [Labilithrix sp.]